MTRDARRLRAFGLTFAHLTRGDSQFVNRTFTRIRRRVTLPNEGNRAHRAHTEDYHRFHLRVMTDRRITMVSKKYLLILVTTSVFLVVCKRLSHDKRRRREARFQATRATRVSVQMSNRRAVIVLVKDKPPTNVFVMFIILQARRIRKRCKRRSVKASNSQVHNARIDNASGEVRVIHEVLLHDREYHRRSGKSSARDGRSFRGVMEVYSLLIDRRTARTNIVTYALRDCYGQSTIALRAALR